MLVAKIYLKLSGEDHSYGAIEQDNKWFINAAQYNVIDEGDSNNKPCEIWMRPDNKSIYHINPMPITLNTTIKKNCLCNFNDQTL